jgi:hypothetical protein
MPSKAPPKVGRPSDYTADIATTICNRIGNGESLRKICDGNGMPSKTTVMRWLAEHKAFRDQYAQAREVQADHYLEEIVEIADDTSGDVIKGEDGAPDRQNSEFVNRSRLRVDTRKWIMARLAPKKYGDKVEHTGPNGGPLVTRIELVGKAPGGGTSTG